MAHMMFLHVKLDVQAAVAAMVSDEDQGAWIGDIIEIMEHRAADLERKAFAAFQTFCTTAHIPITGEPDNSPVSAEWCVETGSEPAVTARHGRTADLIVACRERDQYTSGLDVLEAALLQTGKPVLIVPNQMTTFATDVVAIAWKSSPEAAKAVTAALPFIERTARIVVLSVGEDDTPRRDECAKLVRALRWHNTHVEAQALEPKAEDPFQTLLSAVHHTGAELLVMGGYGHSRLREVVFGGFTRRVLHAAPVPVLIAH